MLQAAELGALAVIDSRPIYLEPESGRVSRQQITFARNIWRPKAMDHVLRISQNDNRSSHWNVNLVGRSDRLVRLRIRIGDLPPPLVSGDLDGNWIFGCESFDTLAGNHAQHKNDEQRDHGDTESCAYSPARSTVCCFIFLEDRKRVACDNACLGAGPDESSDHEDKNHEKSPEDKRVQPFNMAGLRGARVQHMMETRIKRHSLSQQAGRSQTQCRVHLGCSGTPVIPVGVCSGVEDSAAFIFIWSGRFGDTPLGSKPAIDRT